MSCQQNSSLMLVPVGNLPPEGGYLQFAGVPQGRKNPLWLGLPQRLRRLRKQAGLSGRQIALLAGVTNKVIGNIEMRGAAPGIDLIERFAAALGVPATWLAYGHEGYAPFAKKQPRPVVPFDDPVPQLGVCSATKRYELCGERVRQAREQFSLTLRDLEQRTRDNNEHISHQAVLYIETGSNVPKVDTLEIIARALGISPGWLAYGEEE